MNYNRIREIFMRTKIFGSLIVLTLILFSSQGFCDNFEVRRGVIKLGNGITTGMTLNQVKEKFASQKNTKIELFKKSRKLSAYRKINTSTFYFFSECSGKLIYRVILLDQKKYKKTKTYFENICGDPHKDRGKKFYRKGDLGIKFMPYGDDNIINMWQGSIKLWNNFIRNCESSFQLFPEW